MRPAAGLTIGGNVTMATASAGQLSRVIGQIQQPTAMMIPASSSSAPVSLTVQATQSSGKVGQVVQATAGTSGVKLSTPLTAAISQQPGVAKGENLYIVALPPDQLKAMETRALLQQGGNQMLAVINSPDKSKEEGGGKVVLASSGSSTPVSGAPLGPVDKKNVAEILASLSGLSPEPRQVKAGAVSTATAKTTTGTTNTKETLAKQIVATKSAAPSPAAPEEQTPIVIEDEDATPAKAKAPQPVTARSGSRIVRVLQSGTKKLPVAVKSSAPTTPTASSSESKPSPAGRSRKQVFVTSSDQKVEGATSRVKEDEEAKAAGEVEGEASKGVEVGQVRDEEDDQDVLEEDLGEDLEYKPYSKGGKRGRGRGRGGKK